MCTCLCYHYSFLRSTACQMDGWMMHKWTDTLNYIHRVKRYFYSAIFFCEKQWK